MKALAISRVKCFPILVSMAAAGLIVGCGNGGGGGGGPVGAPADEGWRLFTEGKYSQAVVKFNQAIDADSDLATAYDGLGWSYARMGMLQSSIDNFSFVLSVLVVPTQDSYAGASMTYLALKDYENASNMSNWALEVYGNKYSFQYDPDVTDVTLRLVRAISRFHMGLYESSYADVQLLGGPQDLSANDPDFVAKLLEAIQNLREQYGQGLLKT